ncbi:DUF5957 family protein [Salinicoccus halitifaciens]|uniref:Uncharacterized SAM-binding protein YcdF (DUF218 family) n=1 Tax=Salinicoccus halitifaciens TaxID=1073415 RepID=A0ABV2EC76_9STAP|nr:DUF5957 family protein [Salinicoccus halitifaciens]MCD2138801.1 DUF5957 family protein [Salinicoccus halitifaciens]
MRLFIAMLVGLIGGFILGIALTSMIAVFSMMIFDAPFGIKYLPYFTALVCAIIVPMVDQRSFQR